MTISYPVTMPTTPGFVSSTFGLSSNTTVFPSPLSRHEQVLERPGALWKAEFVLPPMRPATAAQWRAFLASLRGRFGTFYGFDPDLKAPLGTATGTILVAGGSQTGNDLAVDGVSVSGTILAGTYFQLENRFYMVVQDATANGSGQATLAINPALRSAPANDAALTFTNPKCIMRLVDDSVQWGGDRNSNVTLQFAAIETL
jgi:hypothetical protein